MIKSLFVIIAKLALMLTCSWPLLLCFGIFAGDIGIFFHRMVILLVVSAITAVVSTFLALFID